MNMIVKAVELVWEQLSYDEKENVELSLSIARQELRTMSICNDTIGETLNIIALQLATLILESRIIVGDDILTVSQYKGRITFLLNEALEHGLIQHLVALEYLYDSVNGEQLYTTECMIGDYIYLSNKGGVSNEVI